MLRNLCLILLSSLSLSAQTTYPLVQIFKANTHSGCSEPSICIDPSDPSRILAGSVLNEFHFSSDSGRTWETGLLNSPYGVWGDPCVIADGLGSLYYFHLSDISGENWRGENFLDRIVCQRSDDGGKTWNEGSFMGWRPPRQQDKEWAVAGPLGSRIYASWTEFDKYGSKDSTDRSRILFSYSTDRAETWSDAQTISSQEGNCLDDDETTEGAVPAAGPHGEVYVAWALNGQIMFNRSLDQGATWWPKEKSIATQPGGWAQKVNNFSRINGMPITVCDVSNGPFRGMVYVLWGDEREGNLDVWFSRSADKGETWSEAIRVNDDSTQADQFLPWLTVDPETGHLYSVFYDRRHDENGSSNHVYLAWSKDAGQTWVNERLTESSFETNEKIFMGDYNNISAYNGMVRPIWVEFRNGRKELWTALIQNVH
jgi:hypothetical protein